MFDPTLERITNLTLSVDRVGITLIDNYLLKTGVNRVSIKDPSVPSPKKVTTKLRKDYNNISKGVTDCKQNAILSKNTKYEPNSNYNHSIAVYHIKIHDKIYGDVSFRLQSWWPFCLIVYVNINKLLVKYCEKNGLAYKLPKGVDNAFESTELSPRSFIHFAYRYLEPETLMKMIRRWLNVLFPSLGSYYYFSGFNQIEVNLDQFIGTGSRELAWEWIYKNARSFGSGKIVFDENCISFKTGLGDTLQFKIYDKDCLIRAELTYNSTFLKKHGLSRTCPEDVIHHADDKFQEIGLQTKAVERVLPRGRSLSRLRSMINSDIDISFLKALHNKCMVRFKNKDLQEFSGLTRNQVYYRFKKFNWLLGKVSSYIWFAKIGIKQLIERLLEVLSELAVLMNLDDKSTIKKVDFSVVQPKWVVMPSGG